MSRNCYEANCILNLGVGEFVAFGMRDNAGCIRAVPVGLESGDRGGGARKILRGSAILPEKLLLLGLCPPAAATMEHGKARDVKRTESACSGSSVQRDRL